jgi:hypothetical protein
MDPVFSGFNFLMFKPGNYYICRIRAVQVGHDKPVSKPEVVANQGPNAQHWAHVYICVLMSEHDDDDPLVRE